MNVLTRIWMPSESLPDVPEGIYNFGERLGTWILEQMGHRPIMLDEASGRPGVFDRILHPLGTIIGHWEKEIPVHLKRHYWGCGWSATRSSIAVRASRAMIHAVRGPMTRDGLGLPHDIPIGDTGLLVREFQRSNESCAGEIILLHHLRMLDKAGEAFAEKVGATSTMSVLIQEDEIEPFLLRLRNARMILSSALHPIIAAAALGVPFAFLFPRGAIPEFPFKYADFCASIGIPFVICHNLVEAVAFWDEWGPKITLPETGRLLDSFPFQS